MNFKKKSLLILLMILTSGVLNFSETVFAEVEWVSSSSDLCSGRITGVTYDYGANPGVNINAGRITFDAHPGTGKEDNQAIDYTGTAYHSTDVAVVTAPAKREDAACVKKISGSAYSKNYDYAVMGWAWDANAGFVSFNCKSGVNSGGGAGVACGAFDYGVYVPAADINGFRQLFGYAWNPTFGYIRFDDDNPGDAITYGVTLRNDGSLAGYGWSNAGIYVNFGGVTMNLPDKKEVVVDKKWCLNKPYVSVCPDVDPATLSFGSGAGVKIADGNDAYTLDLYFRDKDGVAFDPANIKNIDDIHFEWMDTVKLDQVTVDKVAVPGEAASYPLKFSNFTFAGDLGHYTAKVKSYAPTSNAKQSITTSTNPKYYVNNETISKPEGFVLPKEKNDLILKRITWANDLVDKTDPTKVLVPKTISPIFPNGSTAMAFKFRPAVYVDTLYANALQDSILAYRSVPFVVKRGVKALGALTNFAFAVTDQVEFHMTYSKAKTNCQGGDFSFAVTDPLGGVDATKPNDVVIKNSISALKNSVDLNITADISTDPDGALPCKIANGADFYSIVDYTFGQKNVKYFDNGLPRIGADSIVNPALVVHGNIYAQSTGNVQADQRVQTAGSVNINLIRDAINENLGRYAANNVASLTKNFATTNTCSISELSNSNDGMTVSCSSNGLVAPVFTVGSEHVAYFKGANVTLKMDGGDWAGKWVIISDGGNVFIDNDLYNGVIDPAKNISVVALRSGASGDYDRTGNIYIAGCAKSVANLQGTFVADGTIYSYDGNHVDIDDMASGSGEPKWGNGNGDYAAYTAGLSCQMLMQGAMYSTGNTIGGANMDQGNDPKPYILSGGGKVFKLSATIQQRMQAQYHDLNYLRMFKLDLQISAGGLPMDQKCGKEWTPDDQADLILLLAGGKTAKGDSAICGTKDGCNPSGSKDQATACDGINPLIKYGAGDANGDLVIPEGGVTLAKGLDQDKDFDPVYVYYVAPDKDSFLFSKDGAINFSAN